MRSCQACNIDLPEESVFCSSCGNQIGCKSCSATLPLGARFCAQCGTPVEKVSEIPTNGHAADSDAGFNVIEIERGASRLRAKLSDPAVSSLSKPLTIYMAAASGVAVKKGKHGGIPDIELDDEQPMLPGIVAENGHEGNQEKIVEAVVARKGLSAATDEDIVVQRLQELFRERDGELRLEEPDLKAKGKLHYAQRLTYLFLLAQDKAGNEVVPRSSLTTILERAGVYDPHASNWIKNESRIEKDRDTVHLNAGGRRVARAFLEEVFTLTEEGVLPGESNSGGAVKAAGGKGTKQSGKQSAKAGKGKGGRKSEVETTFLPKWKALNLVTNGYSLLKDRSLAEKGTFALWAIRKAAGDVAGKIISESVLATFLYQAFEVKVDKRGLGRALLEESKKKDKKVLHMGGTKFQITPDGMAAAERIAGLNKGKK